ncbi:MAG: cytochrome C oxidase subunit IV family protein [Chloroflexi bacterium]|nr:cytochrome C oxidase subunit IV family protein [Chloroflexota bacterium]
MDENKQTHAQSEHAPNDTVHLPGGRSITLPGGIYTFVFVILALLTVFEIIVAELPDGFFTLPLLLLASLLKAVLVVTFYMHLNTDNRIFRLVLLIPVGVMLLSAMWLLAVPPVAW